MLAAATGPKTLRLVGEVADGVVLTSSAGVDGVARAVTELAAGRESAGRTDGFEVVVNVAIARDQVQLDAVRGWFTELGIDVDDDAALSRFAVWGSSDRIAEGLRLFADAGATTVAVQPTLDEPDSAGLAAQLGEEVRPLLA